MFTLLLLGAPCVVIGATAIALSPGTPRPIVNRNGAIVPGSLSEKAFLEINGAEQGVFIKSRDVLHGATTLADSP